MADADDLRRIARALPAVVEIDSDGFDFRIAGKGIVWSYPERRPGKRRRIRTDIAVLYVGDEAEKQALLLGEPTVFFSTPGYDGWPLVLLRLTEVNADRLLELVSDAWRMRAGPMHETTGSPDVPQDAGPSVDQVFSAVRNRIRTMYPGDEEGRMLGSPGSRRPESSTPSPLQQTSW